MNKNAGPIILQVLLFITLTFACVKSNKNELNDIFPNSRKEILDKENIELRIPNEFKRSSRYRIKEDIPILNEDLEKLRLLQNRLENLEYDDQEVDIFVDTTQSFRLLIILNTQQIEFNKNQANFLKTMINNGNEKYNELNSIYQYGKTNGHINSNGKSTLASFKNTLYNNEENTSIDNNFYFLTTNGFSLAIHEYGSDINNIEKYLWSAKLKGAR